MDILTPYALLLAFVVFLLGASTLALVLAFYVTHEANRQPNKKEGEK